MREPNEDILGTQYQPGQTVVYPYRRSFYMVMRQGVIESATCDCGRTITGTKYSAFCAGNSGTLKVRNPEGKLVTLSRIDNVVVVKKVVADKHLTK